MKLKGMDEWRKEYGYNYVHCVWTEKDEEDKNNEEYAVVNLYYILK